MTVIILPSREARCTHLHNSLVSLIRAQARAWLDAGESTEAFQRVMASELQGLTAVLARELGESCLVGAGTVMSATQVDEVAGAGGRLIVMPHCDEAVICAAKARAMWCAP